MDWGNGMLIVGTFAAWATTLPVNPRTVRLTTRGARPTTAGSSNQFRGEMFGLQRSGSPVRGASQTAS